MSSLAASLGIRGRKLGCALTALALLSGLCGCDYARMREDEAVQTFKAELPMMPEHSVPIQGGVNVLAASNPLDLKNPYVSDSQSAEKGAYRYRLYCAQCHGVDADGRGTVGQSFAPLPTNLKRPEVQEQSDGELFYKISLGFERHPPLAHTVNPEFRWHIINYLRSLAPSRS
ncbi:MAG: c-type cytochrome [Acidobacteriota bacterium]